MTLTTAAQLKSIATQYDSLITDRHACKGAKELQYWLDTCERCIDGNVQVLSGGYSKRNQGLFDRVSESFHRLNDVMDVAKLPKVRHLSVVR